MLRLRAVVALVDWMEETVSGSRASFYRKMEHWQSLRWRPKFPKGSRGSAPTVNMTNTFVNEKKEKKAKRPVHKTQNLMPFRFRNLKCANQLKSIFG